MQLDACTVKERGMRGRVKGEGRGSAKRRDYVACLQGELAQWRRWRRRGTRTGQSRTKVLSANMAVVTQVTKPANDIARLYQAREK